MTRDGDGRDIRRSRRLVPLGVATTVAVLALAALVLYIPPSWRQDLGPLPDALEYAIAARNLARLDTFAISLLGESHPPRYPFGFPALLAPAYRLGDAGLATGIYAVIAYGALTVLLVYVLARRIGGPLAGLVAALVPLVRPLFLDWSHQVMSETATAALVAAVALLVHLVVGAGTGRGRVLLLVGLGLACGLSITVRIAQLCLVPAVLAALLVDPRVRAHPLRDGAAFALGPVLALAALAAYGQSAFGSPTGTGYAYWVPYWYDSDRTFSLAYAFSAPGSVADTYRLSGASNLLFYAVDVPYHLLSLELSVVAGIGALVLLRDRRRPSRATLLFAAVFTVLLVGLYAAYFYQSLRFMAPLLPLAAVCVGVATAAGARLAAEGLRRRRWPSLAGGAVVCGIALVGFATALGPAARRSYAVDHLVRGSRALYAFPWESATAASYAALAPPGSIVVTDVVLPLLEEAGVTRKRAVLPLLRNSYWRGPPLRDRPTFAERRDAIDRALRRGVPVYTDAYSLDSARRWRGSQPELWEALASFRLEPVGEAAAAALLRLRPRPPDDTTELR